MQKTKLQIIEETYEAYKDARNRSYNEELNNCVYLNPDEGKMCAFGRCEIKPPSCNMPSVEGRFFGSLYYIGADDSAMQNALKEEYRGHSFSFWQDLQNLHDVDGYFDGITWSKHGLERIEQLKEIYAENESTNY